ncbi:MAG: VCBS repeat-containing protein [Myxococcales bacterium]|nr:VCBS repeat-containing protein [Myxococcales bacterium]
MRTAWTLLSLALLVAAVLVYPLADHPPERRIGPPDGGLTGEQVAERYCQSCHLLPVPGQLPRETWPFAIDWMGNYLGYPKLGGPFERLVAKRLIPDAPLVSTAEMTRLGRYFIEGALPAAALTPPRAPAPPLEGWTASELAGAGERGAVVTLLWVDEANGRLWVGSANDDMLRVFDRDRKLLVALEMGGDPIHIEPRPRGVRVALAGDFVRDARQGKVVDVALDERAGTVAHRVVLEGLHRTIETHTRDVDGDGEDDLVVVGFGDGVGSGYGKVSIYWSEREEQVLLDRAGGLGAAIVDIDGDGALDVLVLATQGSNELVAHLNRGHRTFERRVLLQRDVSFGFNEMHVLDFDGDGRLDVVTTNGNNMEMPDPPLRPYHGVRVFRGDGALGFEEALFHPLYGALTSVVRDLDGDGDLDIAATGFYPDWRAAEPETFQIVENRGRAAGAEGGAERYLLAPRSLRGEAWNRWMRVAAGDLDGDGRVELFLGAGNVPGGGLHPSRPRQWEHYRERLARAPAVLVLDRRP